MNQVVRWKDFNLTARLLPADDRAIADPRRELWIGAIVAAFNIWMTVRAAPVTVDTRADVPETGFAPGAAATPAE